MAQLNNEIMAEEFLSNSKGAEQLSMDQTCFAPHNFTYCMPGMKTEKHEKIDFTTLSGIIGELDLSIEYVCFCMHKDMLYEIHVNIN